MKTSTANTTVFGLTAGLIFVFSLSLSLTFPQVKHPAPQINAYQTSTPPEHPASCRASAINYSPDASLLGIGTDQGALLIFNAGNLELKKVIHTGMTLGAPIENRRHENYFAGNIAISPDNKLIAAVAVDYSVGIWDIESGDPLFVNWGDQDGRYPLPERGRSGGYFINSRNIITYFLGRGEILGIGGESYSNFRYIRQAVRVEDGRELKIGSISGTDISPHFSYYVDSEGDNRKGYVFTARRTMDWLNWIPGRQVWKDKYYIYGIYDGMILDFNEKVVNADDHQPLPIPDNRGPDRRVITINGRPALIFADVPFYGPQDTNIEIWDIEQASLLGQFSLRREKAWRSTNITGETDDLGLYLAYPIEHGVAIVKLPDGSPHGQINLRQTLTCLDFILPESEWVDKIGDYTFEVTDIPNAEYQWSFYQNGELVWDNLRDEGVLSGSKYVILKNSPAYKKFSEGFVEVRAQAKINEQWSEPAAITIRLLY